MAAEATPAVVVAAMGKRSERGPGPFSALLVKLTLSPLTWLASAGASYGLPQGAGAMDSNSGGGAGLNSCLEMTRPDLNSLSPLGAKQVSMVNGPSQAS